VIARFLLAIGLAILMVVSGTTSYIYLSTRQSKAVAAPQKPPIRRPARSSSPCQHIYLAQSGALYSSARAFPPADAGGWMTMPALYPDGSQPWCGQTGPFSDVYVLTRFGKVTGLLTDNQAAPRSRWDRAQNAWSFYPRLSPDSHTLFMSYDGPKLRATPTSTWSCRCGACLFGPDSQWP